MVESMWGRWKFSPGVPKLFFCKISLHLPTRGNLLGSSSVIVAGNPDPCAVLSTIETMNSAIAAFTLGAIGANAFVAPNALLGGVSSRSSQQVRTRRLTELPT